MFNDRWSVIVEEKIIRLKHIKSDHTIHFTIDKLEHLIKNEDYFNEMFGNILSDRDIIIGKDLINKIQI